ncbi:MAG: hypothetical protein LBH47_00640 [Christensenellaceae bacterium]|jgi:hypothetical protein|nr:hypothetical protein [Christensenellaceae bacterium]
MYEKETFLSKEMVLGDGDNEYVDSRLFNQVFGLYCRATDYAIAHGSDLTWDRPCRWWLSSPVVDGAYVYVVNGIDIVNNRIGGYCSACERGNVAVRPASLFSKIGDVPPNAVMDDDGFYRIKVGEGRYPQTIATPKIQKELNRGAGQKLSHFFTADTVKCDERDEPRWTKHECRSLNGHEYVKVEIEQVDGSIHDNYFIDGTVVDIGKTLWFEVEERERTVGWWNPETLKWSKEPEAGWETWIVDDRGLYAGIQYEHEINGKCKESDFEETDIYKFHTEVFIKEVDATKDQSINIQHAREEVMKNIEVPKRKSRIAVNMGELRPKDKFSHAVEMGVTSIMLHGPSEAGKTAIVRSTFGKELMTSITLANGMKPDEVIGHGDTPPAWYVEHCKKCKANPDKMCCVSIDEVTHAKETVQSLIYPITDPNSRSVVYGKWALPENTVVTLMGNSKEESSDNYNMPEALFRRQELHIDVPAFDVANWTGWGLSKQDENAKYIKRPQVLTERKERTNIHPVVVAFVQANVSTEGVLYSSYDEEIGSRDPRTGQKQRTLGQRKYEMVSKYIYACEDAGAAVESSIIGDFLGDGVGRAFCDFLQKPALYLEDVLCGNTTFLQYETVADKIYAVGEALNMKPANETEKASVEQFIKKYCGDDYLALYQSKSVPPPSAAKEQGGII